MKIERVHFYTRNAARTRDWFTRKIGFKAIATSINLHTHTEVIALNSICLILCSPINKTSPIAKYLNSHPSGVADIAFRVDSIEKIINRARNLGREILKPIQTYRCDRGEFKTVTILGWNDLQHTLIEVNRGKFDYCLEDLNLKLDNIYPKNIYPNCPSSISDIDHIVLNVTSGKLKPAVDLYQALFGFQVRQSFNIQTAKSGLFSQALIDRQQEVQFNINEPTSANSQIQDFIDRNQGSGIQHLALRSSNLIADVAQMQQEGIDFLTVPDSYYERMQKLAWLNLEELDKIARLQILIDRGFNDSQSLLMQIFTQPIFEQPTFFLEFIERRQEAQGFGRGNFKALFEAIEKNTINTL